MWHFSFGWLMGMRKSWGKDVRSLFWKVESHCCSSDFVLKEKLFWLSVDTCVVFLCSSLHHYKSDVNNMYGLYDGNFVTLPAGFKVAALRVWFEQLLGLIYGVSSCSWSEVITSLILFNVLVCFMQTIIICRLFFEQCFPIVPSTNFTFRRMRIKLFCVLFTK